MFLDFNFYLHFCHFFFILICIYCHFILILIPILLFQLYHYFYF